MRRVDVLVIGAGAMGSATAWALARRGVQVLLAEQFAAGHERGSSHGASRIFRRAYTDPYYVSLAGEAMDDWRALEADAGEHLLDLVGVLDHGDPEVVAEVQAAMVAAGLPAERLSVADADAAFPQYRFDRAVLLMRDGGRCRAAATLGALVRRAADHGAEVRFDCGPVAVHTVADDHVVAEVAGDAVRAGVAVVTAGAWLPRLLAHHVPALAAQPDGVDGPVTSPRFRLAEERVVHFAPAPGAPAVESWPSIIHRTGADRLGVGYYGLATPGVGFKLGGHLEGEVGNPDRRRDDAEADTYWAADQAGAAAYAAEWLPGVVPDPQVGPRCLFTYTASHDFVLDRVGPLVIGSPCSGHGFKFTPLIGRLLADLATGRPGRDRFRLGDLPGADRVPTRR